MNFLHELFARYGVSDATVCDNGTQFVSFEFKKFCKTFATEHVTTAPYHPRSYGQAERFVDTIKRALRKSNKIVTDEVALQQFLRIYRVTPNPNTPAGMSPAELMFARKVKSVFDKLVRGKKKRKIAMANTTKLFKNGEKVFVRAYMNGK
ncbi:uncharacterized protein K02A2.6-like [Octopus bimaculoides]|uniref:uncharacterized protein K02A2.6-like n=1 Tax=Octopus bimaculoides TaxID=37653 RepID=UPI00071D41F5|nr:uncharacterized protein K02A2.6-like [Octopus bimaculoides]|eukprot:XP_014785323.1 PREDICTED: uncharacterized protein K02A2.6-like [Octopus bimaculoides]